MRLMIFIAFCVIFLQVEGLLPLSVNRNGLFPKFTAFDVPASGSITIPCEGTSLCFTLISFVGSGIITIGYNKVDPIEKRLKDYIECTADAYNLIIRSKVKNELHVKMAILTYEKVEK